MYKQVILSHPFAGSLYALISNELGADHTKSNSHYYRTLFGKNYQALTDIALTLTIIYPTVIMPYVDIPLPEIKKWETEYGYENKDLGMLFYSGRKYSEWYNNIYNMVISDENDDQVKKILNKLPKRVWFQILLEARYEIHLSYIFECPVICSKGRKALINRLMEIDLHNRRIETLDGSVVQAIEEYMDFCGLLFNPKDLDTLHFLKNDSTIKEYAKSFNSIIDDLRYESNIKLKLFELFKESMNKSQIIKSASGIFDTSSEILSYAGFIPSIETIANISGLVVKAGEFGISKYQRKHEWFQFAPQLKYKLSLKELEKKIDEQLKNLNGQ